MALTAEQLAALRAEIADDPKARGYGQFLPDAPGMVVQLLSELSDNKIKTIRSTTAQAWAATGPMAGIVDACAAGTDSKPANPCRASCLLVQLTLSAGSDIHVDMPDVQAMFKAWVDAGVITQLQHDDLYVRAMQPASRLEVLGLPQITEADVRAAS